MSNRALDTKRILFMTDSLSNGGAEKVTATLANALAKEKEYNVTIACLRKDKNEYQVSENVETLYRESYKTNKYVEMISEFQYFKRIIKEHKPDVVISLAGYRTNIVLCLVEMFRKHSLIISDRSAPSVYPKGRIFRFLRDITYNLPDGIVFQTNGACKYYKKRVQNKGIIIPNSVFVSEHHIKTRRNTVINCSRLEDVKNIDLLIDGFALISKDYPSYELEIFGQGYLENSLRNQAERLGIEKKVHFRGYKTNIEDEIYDGGIYVSVSKAEGLSNSMLEALALGIPTICTDCPDGGARMVIKSDFNGILIPVGDEESLVSAMKRIIDDRSFADRLSANAIESVKQYSPQRIAKMWKEYIEKVSYERKQK